MSLSFRAYSGLFFWLLRCAPVKSITWSGIKLSSHMKTCAVHWKSELFRSIFPITDKPCPKYYSRWLANRSFCVYSVSALPWSLWALWAMAKSLALNNNQDTQICAADWVKHITQYAWRGTWVSSKSNMQTVSSHWHYMSTISSILVQSVSPKGFSARVWMLQVEKRRCTKFCYLAWFQCGKASFWAIIEFAYLVNPCRLERVWLKGICNVPTTFTILESTGGPHPLRLADYDPPDLLSDGATFS